MKSTLALTYALTEIKPGCRQKIEIRDSALVQAEKFRFVGDLDGPSATLSPTGPKKPGPSAVSFCALSTSFWLKNMGIHARPSPLFQFFPPLPGVPLELPRRSMGIMKTNEDHCNENKQRLFILILQQQGQPMSLTF